MQPAIFLAGHGSRDPEGTQDFLRLVDAIRVHEPARIVECGFLEFARPVIADGIDRCVGRGATTIAVLPAIAAALAMTRRPDPAAELRAAEAA